MNSPILNRLNISDSQWQHEEEADRLRAVASKHGGTTDESYDSATMKIAWDCLKPKETYAIQPKEFT